VRALTRQQFFKRALGLEISTKRLPRGLHDHHHPPPAGGAGAPPQPGNGAWLDLSMPASQPPRF
jgi:hypothetical protein